MSDGVKSEISSDIDQNYSLNSADPKNVQELTIYVSRTKKKEFSQIAHNIKMHKFFLFVSPQNWLGANIIAKCSG